MTDPTLVHRIYNGLDVRQGWPVIHLRDTLGPIGGALPAPKGALLRRPFKLKPTPKKPWWRKLIKSMFGI